jgi:pilus assembly protein CpaC
MKFHIAYILILAMTFSQVVRAADDSDGDDSTYRSRQYISVTMGIEQEIKLPTMPDEIDSPKGDFRQFVDIEYSKKQGLLRITPKKIGFGTLSIYDKKNHKKVLEYQIDVLKSDHERVAKEIRSLIGDIEGVTIKVINNRVVVDGQVLLPKDLSRIYRVVQQFGDQASMLVTISPLAQKKIAEFIARDINNPEIDIKAVNGKFVLTGFANSQDEKDKAEIISKIYVPDIVVEEAEEKGLIKVRKCINDCVINLIAVKDKGEQPPPKLVQLVVHFVELNKDYSKAFNIGWAPSLSDDGSTMTVSSGGSGGGVITTLTATINNLLPRLNWAKEHGHARILESTSLVVEDGKKGEIKQVTNQPYSVIGKDNVQGTAFAEIGIRSAITAAIMPGNSGTVGMDMEFSLSNLLGFDSKGAPITSANTINTRVSVRDKQSAAVGGLIRNATFTNYNRLPSGAKNPIINLYASKAFQRQQSQFVVFVTPVIKASASAGSEQIKKKFRMHD